MLTQFKSLGRPHRPRALFASTPSSDSSPDAPRGVTRSREDDAEDAREVKRLKMFGTQVARQVGIPADSLDCFVELEVKQMLITLMARIIALEAEKVCDENEELLRSKKFGRGLAKRVLACLLSPNLSAYVTEVTDHVVNFIRKNPVRFKVPLPVLEDPELVEVLAGLVSVYLTDLCSAIKQKMNSSIKKGQDIATLVARLVYKTNIEMTVSHWIRIAFLRRCLVVFNQLKKKEVVPFDEAPEATLAATSRAVSV
ncbi:hypothetical protein EW026_g8211 [Hermanssonia centrifuga]|uniref:Uncharacterized protein n=1 Tax=Hermanssonia centrifuga TaxID=98765 RepID=A0A4S4K524_9APHY|nr:hypothetical protein EW026_g8211 [Hermanssonia centrifuga]